MSYFYVDGSEEERFTTFGEARRAGRRVWMVVMIGATQRDVQVWDPDRWDDTATPEDILSDWL